MKIKLFKKAMAFATAMVMALGLVTVLPKGSMPKFGITASATEDVITISSPAELNAIRNNLNGSYQLIGNIDMSAFGNWIPIGLDSPFTGTLDGNGYSIKNLSIDYSSSNQVFNCGLFAVVSGGTVKNLGLDNVKITSTYTSSDVEWPNTAGIAGGLENSGSIQRCYVTGNITANNANESGCRVAGIVGYTGSNSTVSNCYVNATLIGEAQNANTMVGGIAAWLASSTSITNSYATGTISGTNSNSYCYAGGIAASGDNGTITNSVALEDSINTLGSTIKCDVVCEFSTCNNCAYLKNISGNASTDRWYNWNSHFVSGEYKALNADDTKLQETYTGLGWDFSNIWNMSDGGYPVLQCFEGKGYSDTEVTTEDIEIDVQFLDENGNQIDKIEYKRGEINAKLKISFSNDSVSNESQFGTVEIQSNVLNMKSSDGTESKLVNYDVDSNQSELIIPIVGFSMFADRKNGSNYRYSEQDITINVEYNYGNESSVFKTVTFPCKSDVFNVINGDYDTQSIDYDFLTDKLIYDNILSKKWYDANFNTAWQGGTCFGFSSTLSVLRSTNKLKEYYFPDSWTDIEDADKYTVYQYIDGKYKAIKTTTDTTYTVSNLATGKYKFIVRYTVNGKLSPTSKTNSLTVSIKNGKPYPTATVKNNVVTIQWQAVDDAEKYAIYLVKNGKASKLKETDKRVVKYALKAGKEYQFIVRAYVDGKWTTMKTSDIVKVTAE